MKSFEALASRYVQETFCLFPTYASQMGIHDHDHRLESFSRERREDTLRALKTFARKVREISSRDTLSPVERYEASLMELEISTHLLNLELLRGWEKDPAFYAELLLYSAYFLVEREGGAWEHRLKALVSRMRRYPNLLKEARRNLKNPPRLFTEVALEVVQGGIQFFKSLDFNRSGISETLKRSLERERTRTLELLEEYARWLKEKLLPRSRGRFAVGKNLYNRLLREHHLLPYSASEIREIASKHFDRILQEMSDISRKLDSEKTWAEILQESSRNHPSPEGLVAAYREITGRTRAFIVERNLVPLPPHEQVVVRETPTFNRSFFPFAAYMPPPLFEERGTGEFWVTPVPHDLPPVEVELRMKEHAHHKIPIIVLHETYPGHHVQFSYLRELKSPLQKRAFSSVSCEGWAFYCEQMMKEEGFCQDALTTLSQLKDELWRIARVILDVDLQTRGLSPARAVEFLMERIGFPKEMAWGEIKRYVREPTQPMSYFIGKMEILKLREEYARARGPDSRLVDFHRDFLSCGAVPVRLARQRMMGDS